MRRMLVRQRRRGITKQKFRDDQESNIFLTIQRLLKNVAAVAVCSEFDDSSPVRMVNLVRPTCNAKVSHTSCNQ